MTEALPAFLSEELQDYLGFANLRLELTLNLGGASHLAMLRHAVRAIEAGDAETVLIVSAGKFRSLRQSGRGLMRLTCHPDYELPYAPSVPALYGLIAQRWMHDTGATKRDLAEVVVVQDAWAKRSSRAITHDHDPITAEQVLDSRPIAGPFSYLDCSIPCEGGGALVVASARRARRGPHRPVHVLAFGEAHSHGYLTSIAEPGRTAAARSGPMALDRAGRRHRDLDLLELYDAFSSNPLMTLEEIGLATPGRAADLYRDGRTGPGGDLPVNTNGGLIRFGHAGTASGLTGLLEAYLQLSGRAAGGQVEGADIALVHAYGSMLCSHITAILEGA
jgi:acetyl-CoA acetyltransferase